MTYAMRTDMTARFAEEELIQLTDRDRLGQIDTAVLDRALADADAEINGYLSVRYTLPLAPAPTVLVRLAADLARYYLYDDHAPEQIKQRYDDAVKFLRAVATGTAQLGTDAAQPVPAVSGGARYRAGERVFSAETLRDY